LAWSEGWQSLDTVVCSSSEPGELSQSLCHNVSSGVFTISVRRGRGAVGVEGWGVVETLPQKKIIFCPQNDKFECILMQFLTGRKHGQTLEYNNNNNGTRILRFICKTKLTKTVQKFTVRPRAVQSHHRPLPPLNTPLNVRTVNAVIVVFCYYWTINVVLVASFK